MSVCHDPFLKCQFQGSTDKPKHFAQMLHLVHEVF